MSLTNVDLNKLMTFLVIAETGGVTPAARRLALTRSAVSHSLAALESSLGISLFHRVGKRLVPTREAVALRRALEDVRDRLESCLAEALGAGQEVRGTLRVGLFLGFSRFRLAGAIDGFLRAHARARVRVVFAPEAWLLGRLLAGRLDFTVSLRSTRGVTPRVRSEKLFEQSLVLAVKRVAGRRTPSLEDVTGLPVVDYYQSDPLVDHWLRHHRAARRMPRQRIRVWAASTDLALELVRAGVGAAVLPEDVVAPFRRSRELAVIRGPREPLRDAVWLNELPGAARNRTQAAFREHLLSSLAATAPGG